MGTESVRHVVDAAHMRNIGEQSISNKIQAVLEIVKNAYDADALSCSVRIHGVRSGDDVHVSKIEVQDDGVGMTRDDIKNKLMKVGTTNKISESRSPKFQRRVVGEKGMGHYSLQRLGERAVITTSPENYEGRAMPDGRATHVLDLDWGRYVSGEDLHNIAHTLSTTAREAESGTLIEITGLKDVWRDKDLNALHQNIGSMMLPDWLQSTEQDRFSASIEPVGFKTEIPDETGNLLDYATYKLTARLRGSRVHYAVSARTSPGKFSVIKKESVATDATCGNAEFELHWFYSKTDIWYKGVVKSHLLREQLFRKHGIKIYNDNVRIMPYGEENNDWLGLEPRKIKRGGGILRQDIAIGFVRLSRRNNPGIIETATREALTENEAFESLKRDFILESIKKLEAAAAMREKKKIWQAARYNYLDKAMSSVTKTSTALASSDYAAVSANLLAASKDLAKHKRTLRVQKEKHAANIAMYRNLSTIGIQLLAFNHEIMDYIVSVRTNLSLLSKNKSLDKTAKADVSESLGYMEKLIAWSRHIRQFSSLLSRSRDPSEGDDVIDVRETLLGIKRGMSLILSDSRITMNDPLVEGTVPKIRISIVSFESVITNLITNSIRALSMVDGRDRRIDVHVSTAPGNIVIRFEDNGAGIPEEHVEYIFEAFYTTHNNRVEQGTGMGLTIAREIVENDYHGTIVLERTVDEKSHPGGGMASFLIRLPLTKVGAK